MNRLFPVFDVQETSVGSARSGLRGNMAVLYREGRLIIAITIVALAFSLFISVSAPPSYTARSQLLIDHSATALIDQRQMSTAAFATTARLDGEVELVRSEAVFRTILSDLGIGLRPDLLPERGVLAQINSALRAWTSTADAAMIEYAEQLAALAGMVSVERRGHTNLIDIVVRHGNPALAAEIANAVATVYIDQQLRAKSEAASEAAQVLRRRLTAARDVWFDANSAIDLYLVDNLDRISWTQAGQFMEALTRERGQQHALLETQTTLVSSDEVEAAGLHSDSVRLADMADLPQTELDGLRLRLRDEISQIDLPADISANLFVMLQRAEHARALYQVLMAEVQRLDSEAIAPLADARRVSRTSVPEPDSPDMTLSAAFGIILGLASGTGAALMRNAYIGGLNTVENIRASFGLRHVLSVPRVAAARADANIADLLLSSPVSPFSESIRRIRLAIETILASQGRGSVVLVTSAGPAEGKTSIALALTRAFAETGRKTIAVDADLRRPGLHLAIGYRPDHGVGDRLALGSRDLSECIVDDPLSSAVLMLGAHACTRPTDRLLRSPDFSELLNGAQRDHDIVLLDSAPLGPVVDTHYLARHAAAVVLVIDWTQTGQDAVALALGELRQGGVNSDAVIAVCNRASGPVGLEPRYAAYSAKESG